MSLKTIKRLAADILKIGENKVRISSERISEAESAMTRNDVKDLIKSGVVGKRHFKGRASVLAEKKASRKDGRRKGPKFSKVSRKERWMIKVRALRNLLNSLIEKNAIDKEHKRSLYLKIKGNAFKGKRAMLNYLKDNKILKGDIDAKG